MAARQPSQKARRVLEYSGGEALLLLPQMYADPVRHVLDNAVIGTVFGVSNAEIAQCLEFQSFFF